MDKNAPQIMILRNAVEQNVKRKMKTPSDFLFLSGVIWERTHETISPTTLKRLWGYIDGADSTRRSTLNLLSRFIGYEDWDAYLAAIDEQAISESDIFQGDGLRAEDLKPGDHVEVTWMPNRRCVFLCLGGQRFAVVENENSKLSVGDTFEAAFFIIGQPMYLDNLVRGDQPPTSYVAGSKSGLVSVKVLSNNSNN